MSWITDFTDKNSPIVALAPMDGYCDSAFRSICHRVAPEIVVFSEFYSADGLYHNPDLAKKVLTHDPIEHPLVFQIFGNDPEIFLHAGKLIEQYGAQGIDINMGCPAKKIVKCGYGSGLMIDRDRAMKIVNTLAENLRIPVSVKTRLGWTNSDGLIEFGQALEQAGASCISVHGRTFEQEYGGTANWEPIFELQKHIKIPVLGNGDVKNYEDGLKKIQSTKYKVQNDCGNTPPYFASSEMRGPGGDEPEKGKMKPCLPAGRNEKLLLSGFMIGRAALGNPWCFLPNNYVPTWEERITIMREHMERMVKTKGENRACLEIRKHFTHYLHGFDGVKEFRKRLALVITLTEAKNILQELNLISPTLDTDE